ncbi:MAG: hypothetical protein SGPRY_014650 [Prymnesium sp.]
MVGVEGLDATIAPASRSLEAPSTTQAFAPPTLPLEALGGTTLPPQALDPNIIPPQALDPTTQSPQALDPTTIPPRAPDPATLPPRALDPTAQPHQALVVAKASSSGGLANTEADGATPLPDSLLKREGKREGKEEEMEEEGEEGRGEEQSLEAAPRAQQSRAEEAPANGLDSTSEASAVLGRFEELERTEREVNAILREQAVGEAGEDVGEEEGEEEGEEGEEGMSMDAGEEKWGEEGEGDGEDDDLGEGALEEPGEETAAGEEGSEEEEPPLCESGWLSYLLAQPWAPLSADPAPIECLSSDRSEDGVPSWAASAPAAEPHSSLSATAPPASLEASLELSSAAANVSGGHMSGATTFTEKARAVTTQDIVLSQTNPCQQPTKGTSTKQAQLVSAQPALNSSFGLVTLVKMRMRKILRISTSGSKSEKRG